MISKKVKYSENNARTVARIHRLTNYLESKGAKLHTYPDADFIVCNDCLVIFEHKKDITGVTLLDLDHIHPVDFYMNVDTEQIEEFNGGKGFRQSILSFKPSLLSCILGGLINGKH